MDILNLVAKIHEYKGRQDLYIRQKPVELERLVEIAKIQSTEASNKIEGIVTTSTRIKQLFEEKTTPRNREEDEIMGYREVLNTIQESNEYIPIRPSYILQLHRDLLKRAGFSYGGSFKSVQNYINETKPDGTVVTRFTPIAPYDTPDAVERLCTAYEQAIASETRRHVSLDGMDYEGELFASAEDTEGEAVRREDVARLYSTMEALAPSQRELVEKVYFEKCSFASIVREEGVGESAIRASRG